MPTKKVSPDIMRCLCDYQWPGNVRELQNVTERIFFLSDNEEIEMDTIPAHIHEFNHGFIPEKVDLVNEAPVFSPEKISIANYQKIEKQQKNEDERLEILELLKQHQGNITHAAKAMGISRAAFYRKLEKYSVN